MKKLYLLRHADAETGKSKDDLHRNLTQKGKKEARILGEKMLEQDLRPQHIISSHANRAYQTAEIIAELLAFPVKNIQIEQGVYAGDEDGLLAVIESIDDMHDGLMLVGHNPYLSYLVSKFAKHADTLETAGMAIFVSNANTWENISRQDMRLDKIIAPGEDSETPSRVNNIA